MKRVIQGVAYNTDTATLIGVGHSEARDEDGDPMPVTYTERLYQTRGGAFFIHYHQRTRTWSEEDRAYVVEEHDRLQPVGSHGAVEAWVRQVDIDNPLTIELFDEKVFAEVPEATAPIPSDATIYLRLPVTLKQRVETGAKANSISTNAFVMRCLERCTSETAVKPAVLP